MSRTYFEAEMVKCLYPNGVIEYVPVHLMNRVVAMSKFPDRDYVDYPEGAIRYCMSERKFFDLVKAADAKRKVDGKVLASIAAINYYIETFCRED